MGHMATHQALISFSNGSLVMEMKVITAGLPPRVRGPSSAVRFLECYPCMAYIIELQNPPQAHGGSLGDMHLKYGTMEGLMNRICPRWSQINEIMAPQTVDPTPEDE
ncbi:hypothetical protein H4Q26_016522 [Puccinia striiformis f. sp. tritici PST-130]|nr:hypothetical protein H4Q26_016522 [Puccinia striiformis f. sp. tritici PST-130]